MSSGLARACCGPQPMLYKYFIFLHQLKMMLHKMSVFSSYGIYCSCAGYSCSQLGKYFDDVIEVPQMKIRFNAILILFINVSDFKWNNWNFLGEQEASYEYVVDNWMFWNRSNFHFVFNFLTYVCSYLSQSNHNLQKLS